MTLDGISGVRFAVWARMLRGRCRGRFQFMDRRRNPMRLRHSAGVWEIFVPRVAPGSRYKYAISGPGGEPVPLKADPVARRTETPPDTASVLAEPDDHVWRDHAWMQSRGKRQASDAPISIYEVHIGSWLKKPPAFDGTLWDFTTEKLVPYLVEMGSAHLGSCRSPNIPSVVRGVISR